MADMTFTTPPGQTVGRELLVAYLNVGTKEEPVWAPVGRRVENSSIEMDWGIDSKVDIFGNTYVTGKKATKTQTFDPWELDSGDEAQRKILNLAIRENDINALLNQDMLIAHLYADNGTGSKFGERYSACSVIPTGFGGEGGGSIWMPIEVTYGGERTIGSVSPNFDGTVEFLPE